METTKIFTSCIHCFRKMIPHVSFALLLLVSQGEYAFRIPRYIMQSKTEKDNWPLAYILQSFINSDHFFRKMDNLITFFQILMKLYSTVNF